MTIRKVSLLQGRGFELEIAASGPVKPEAQVITGPDRIVLDFPNALPAAGIHSPLNIGRPDVKDARIGIFSSNPPVTRVVLDLNSPQTYQLFPSANSVVVKVGANLPILNASASVPETIVSIERPDADSARSPDMSANPAPAIAPPAPPAPKVEVSFQNGLLSIYSEKANMAEVLAEVHRKTGAEILIPPGAESEEVFTSLGPAAPKEVLASLLNGSNFNFIVIGSEHDPGGLHRVVLTPKQGGAAEAVVYPCGATQPAMAQAAPDPVQQSLPQSMPPEQPENAGDTAAAAAAADPNPPAPPPPNQ